MKIYRIEHKESGLGPYRHQVNGQRWCELDPDIYHRMCSMKCPAPYHESHNIKSIFDGGNYAKWFFGFESIKQIKRWFSKKIIKALINDGFIIACYELNEADVESSEYQLIFIMERATKLERQEW